MTSYTPTSRRPDWATLIVAAALTVAAGAIFRDASQLPQSGGYGGVGPADVPRWVASGLLILAIWSAITAFRNGTEPRAKSAPAPVLWIVAGLLAQLLLLKVAGFSIATGLLFAGAAAGFGKRNFLVTLPLGIAFGALIFAIFGGLLELSLPAGPLERLFTGG
jgi:putative tricarboxylic transport membrane protein